MAPLGKEKANARGNQVERDRSFAELSLCHVVHLAAGETRTCFERGLMNFGRDKSRCKAVDANSQRIELDSQSLCESHNGRLGNGICAVIRQGVKCSPSRH